MGGIIVHIRPGAEGTLLFFFVHKRSHGILPLSRIESDVVLRRVNRLQPIHQALTERGVPPGVAILQEVEGDTYQAPQSP